MTTDDDLLTAVRESFAGARLDTPLDATIRRGRRLRGRRRRGGVAAAVVLAAGLTVAGLVASRSGQPAPQARPTPPATLAAWTVTKGPGHTVTILVRQLRDPAGLERTLRADGVPAAVAFQGGMLSDTPPVPHTCQNVRMSDSANADLQGKIIGLGLGASPREIALVIHAAEIPRGIGLNLTVQTNGSGYGWSLGLVQASPACTGS
jgi:hypothetical protein